MPGVPTLPVVQPKERTTNIWKANGKTIVSIAPAQAELKASVRRSIDLLGGLSRLVKLGDDVFLKPNFNSTDPFPASTDMPFLRAVVELLREAGARHITVGDCCGRVYWPSRQQMERMGAFQLAKDLDFELLVFEESDDYVKVDVGGEYLKEMHVPRAAYEADKMVYLPCLKTHRSARFTTSLKVALGFSAPGDRTMLHAGNLEEKVAEISLIFQPDLIVMDARKAFVTDGPASGTVVEPGVVLTSGDLVALDVEALRILKSYPASNRLDMDVWEFPQIAQAVKHGLGARSEADYVVMRG
ncbi:MAG: DUF362 domain-containing protein [Bacteroidetes bacterium]|nr:DUF362 domain-containing protein [Bacteroidota bacterium]MCL5025540.1 DUF362 domain-containing protein [Chloroflexota bacterium]